MVDIVSSGYTGPILDPDWAAMGEDLLGNGQRVESGFTGTPVATGTRQTSVSAGVAYGGGVRDIHPAATVVQHPVVASGTRWDAICLRRDYAARRTTLAVVPGTTSKALPTSLNRDVGVLHDHPILLVPITAGQTVPGTPIRTGGRGKLTAPGVASRALISAEADDANVELPTGEVWPNFGEQLTLDIPPWAARYVFAATWFGVRFDGGSAGAPLNAGGAVFIKLGNEGELVSSQSTYDAKAGAGVYREPAGTAGTLSIPEWMRGTTQILRPYGAAAVGSTAFARVDGNSSFGCTGMWVAA